MKQGMLKQVQHDNYVMEAGTRRPMGLDSRLRGDDTGFQLVPTYQGGRVEKDEFLLIFFVSRL
ncbi:MAG TPA: hypothetical protein VMX96_04075 [Dehalococcoidia bacterium]|nr:hypothetical protein [Dehalococcoidia bacterium]